MLLVPNVHKVDPLDRKQTRTLEILPPAIKDLLEGNSRSTGKATKVIAVDHCEYDEVLHALL